MPAALLFLLDLSDRAIAATAINRKFGGGSRVSPIFSTLFVTIIETGRFSLNPTFRL
jgi:hypothetical protein